MKPEYITAANVVYNKLIEAGAGDKVTLSEIESMFAEHEKRYVPVDDATATVQKSLTKKLGLSVVKGNKDSKLGEIPVEANVFVNVKGKVTRIFDNTNEKIMQKVLLADETGKKIVTVFAKTVPAEFEPFEVGKSYTVTGVTTSVYNGGVTLNVNSKTVIATCADVEAETVISAVVISMFKDSGLIKRCSVCKKPLQKGVCTEHGKNEGEYDIRVRGTLDTGKKLQVFSLNAEVTKALTGIDVAVAKKMAMDACDPGAVAAEIQSIILGKYFTVKGEMIESRKNPGTFTLFADSIVKHENTATDLAAVKARIEALGGV